MPYPSDLTDNQWELIKDLVSYTRPKKHKTRILVNAVLYLTKTGCQWRPITI